jgi:type II secretion system protein G
MKRNGFTLVEILIVIAIMGILALVTVTQFTAAKTKARDVARKSDLNTVAKALNTFYADYGKFPKPTGGENDATVIDINDLMEKNAEFKDKDNYTYVKIMPRENKGGKAPFCYKWSNDQKSFALFSILENTNDGDFGEYPVDCTSDGSGIGVTYNYAIVSPNTNVLDFTKP